MHHQYTHHATLFFIDSAGKYKEELNRDNPLGMKGHVAEAYGKLIETLWSGKSSSTAPREFKVKS